MLPTVNARVSHSFVQSAEFLRGGQFLNVFYEIDTCLCKQMAVHSVSVMGHESTYIMI